MRFLLRTILVPALLLSCFACVPADVLAGEAPAYTRQRMSAMGGYRGDHSGWRHARRHAGFYPGYYPYQPIVTGSWYARPYPYHFDYYRWRYSAPPQTVDYPCAEAPVQ